MVGIAVAGATGAVGQHVSDILTNMGVTVVGIARSRGVDLVTGHGVDAALRGVDAVIDVSGVVANREHDAVEFFTQATHNLQRAIRRNGVGRHVVLSVVGTDKINSGYYVGKRAQEQLVMDSDVPATILRATQFHEFAGQMLQRFSFGPVSVVLKMLCRPVAAVEVAERLVQLALAPVVAAPEQMAGPECLYLEEMIRRLCRWRHQRRLLLPLRAPGKSGPLMAAGALLPEGDFLLGRRTFDQWLQTQPSARPAARVGWAEQ